MYALSKLNKKHEQTWVNLQKTLTHDQPLNIYTIFVGYPGTGMFNRLTAGGLSIMTDTYKTL